MDNNKKTTTAEKRVALLGAKFINRSISKKENDELDDLIGDNDGYLELFEKLIQFYDIDRLNNFLLELGVDFRVTALRHLRY